MDLQAGQAKLPPTYTAYIIFEITNQSARLLDILAGQTPSVTTQTCAHPSCRSASRDFILFTASALMSLQRFLVEGPATEPAGCQRLILVDVDRLLIVSE